MSQDTVRAAHHVSGCEAKESDTGHEEAILAAIVLDQARAMSLAVVTTQPVKKADFRHYDRMRVPEWPESRIRLECGS